VPRPNWEWIKIDVQITEHPKVEGLSDKAFRALIELWCYCGRQHTDGIVTERQWKAWPPKVRAELIARDLAHPLDIGGGAVMHDYTDHQRSREQIDELSAKRTDAAKKAAAARWGGRPPPDTKTHALPHAKTHPARMHVPMPEAVAEADTWRYAPTVTNLRPVH